MVSWTETELHAGPAEQVVRAMLAQWRALAAPGDYRQPKLILCDRCEAVVPEEETVGGGYCARYCLACWREPAEGEWTPEEWFEEGEAG